MAGTGSLCPLCGARTNGSYCYAHSWAAGEGGTHSRPARPSAPRTPKAPQTTGARLELVAGPSTGSGRRLVPRRTA